VVAPYGVFEQLARFAHSLAPFLTLRLFCSLSYIINSSFKAVRGEGARILGIWIGVGGFGLVPKKAD